jgi:CubicO group peptidase (beta-lactamase class C family)
MRFIIPLIAILIFTSACSQTIPATADQRRQAVENNLSPDIIYGDSLPHFNLEKQMAAYGIKGVSIAVIKDFKIDWAKGYGWADEQEKRPVTTDTRFQAASISKSLNSLGLMKLVEQGKIDLDADINNYLKSWKFPYDSLSKGKKISLRNLLSHSAGLSIHGFRGYETGDTLPTVIQILNGEKPANSKPVRSMFEPSLRMEYSGGGTTITQLLVTDITGQTYEDYMKKTVLQPIGMTNSFYNQPPPPGTKNLATAYYGNGQPVKGLYHIYPEKAAAGLWTTPTDLCKYIIETQLAYQGKSAKVLSQKTMQTRLTPYIDSSAALGTFLFRKPTETWFTHNGSNEAFMCNSFGSLKNGNGIVVMINSDNYAIIPEITNSVAQVYGWKDFYTPVFKKKVIVPHDTLQLYTGSYLLVKDTLSVSFCGEELCIRQNGNPPYGLKMIFGTMTEASMTEVQNLIIRFVRNEDGKVGVMEVVENGAVMRCGRVN